MIEFITTYWIEILIVLVFIAAIVFFALRGKKDIIYKMLYALVTEAEKQFGTGTGSLKFAYVMERAYAALPAIIKVFITYEKLAEWIELALVEAKKHWAQEAGLTEYTKN